MKNSFTLTASLLMGLGTLSAQTSNINGISDLGSGTHQFTVSGQVSDVSLCTYEICQRSAEGTLEVLPVVAGSASALLGKTSVPDAENYLVFYPIGKDGNPNARLILKHKYLIKIANNASLEEIQNRCGIRTLKRLREGSNLVICEEESSTKVLTQLSSVLSDPSILEVEPLFARNRSKKQLIVPSDPFYDTVGAGAREDNAHQWYLNNTGENGGLSGIDINIEGALAFATGAGITVAIVDDGLAIDHDDLAANATGPHLNLLDGDEDDPTTFDILSNHGTAVAGLVGAAFNNGIGISGAAPEATLSGVRLIGDEIDDEDEASALSFNNDTIQVYSNSWGPSDDTLDFEGPGTLAAEALQAGAIEGRPDADGTPLGNIFVWAGGNGGEIGDNSNYDGYANSRFTIAVGAIADNGQRSIFSEQGANLVVVAPSGGGSQEILTTSFGVELDANNNLARTSEFDTEFSGTSASTPLVSGVVALMLQENPDLTWRDVQDILIRTAVRVDDAGGAWTDNAAGIDFSHSYGSGLIDADQAVRFAANNPVVWEPLGPAVSQERLKLFIPGEVESGEVPDGTGDSFFTVFDMSVDEDGNAAENLKVEHVELRARIITQSRSDLEIVLISPNGTQSILHEPNPNNDEQSISNWVFMTTHNWGEGSAGQWVVRVTDSVSGNAATVNNLSLIIHGSPDEDAPVGNDAILTSESTIDVQQNEEINYLVETVGASSVAVTNLPEGLSYDSEAQVITGSVNGPGLFTIAVSLTDSSGAINSFNVSLIVRPVAVALGQAIGLDDFPAILAGDLPWDFDSTNSSDGDGQSASSNIDLADGQDSIFGFNGLPEGFILFDWLTSSEEGFDRLYFNRGGEVPHEWDAFISGARDWGRVAVALPNSSNNLRWIYDKDATVSVGEDRGLVDNVEFVTEEKFRNDIISAANIEGFDFNFDSKTAFYPFLGIIGSENVDGVQAVIRSSSVGNGQSVSMSGWVEGPGTFSCSVINLAEAADVFELLVDGVVMETLEGLGAEAGAFDPVVYSPNLDNGRHFVQLRFTKDFRGSDALVFQDDTLDAVLLDDIAFIPAGGFAAFTTNDVEDSDDYSDFEEYAFGGNLAISDVPQYLPKVISSDGQNFVEYGINTSIQDVDYTALQSTDLEEWEPAQGVFLDRTVDGVQYYRIPTSGVNGELNLFYKVLAEMN